MSREPLLSLDDFSCLPDDLVFGQTIPTPLRSQVSKAPQSRFPLGTNDGFKIALQPLGNTRHPTTRRDRHQQVVERRLSASRPDTGIVRLRHTGRNQKGEIVLTFERSCLMKMRPASAP